MGVALRSHPLSFVFCPSGIEDEGESQIQITRHARVTMTLQQTAFFYTYSKPIYTCVNFPWCIFSTSCAKPCNTPTQGATSEPFYDIPADTSPQDVPTRTPIRRKQAGVSDGSGSSVNEIQHEQRHDYSWSDRDHGCFLDVEALIHSLPNIVIPPGQSQSHSYLTLVPDPEPPGHTSAGTAETVRGPRYSPRVVGPADFSGTPSPLVSEGRTESLWYRTGVSGST
ncbi:hypothetical protein BaRGS_00005394 [Batillaria attramentaria]|uniref:Uncharacterized protein n=1 Tax=Batillaria attramentaria TaxID=370345 RepID=A0ABD0LW86_9CAEN